MQLAAALCAADTSSGPPAACAETLTCGGGFMDFHFYMPVQVVSGEGAVARNSTLLRSLGRRCLIVTGGSSAKCSGALADITAALDVWEIGWSVYDRIGPNPLVSACYEAGVVARSVRAEFIIGIGGGSPLDAAKAAAIFAANPSLAPMDIFRREYPNPPLPLALVGTTAGTGSEVSPVSVLTIDESGRKKSISGPDCYARIAFADPSYTHSVPFDVTVSTALDAFAHATEGWFNPSISDPVKLFAVKGLPLLWNALIWLDRNDYLPEPAMRERLYYGSLYAGVVLSACGTAFPHPLGYVLTEDFGIPHGRACTAFMPAFLERGARFAPARAEEYYRLLGTDFDTLRGVVERLTDASAVQMMPEQVSGYCARWEDVKNFRVSPGGFTAEDAGELLTKLFVCPGRQG